MPKQPRKTGNGARNAPATDEPAASLASAGNDPILIDPAAIERTIEPRAVSGDGGGNESDSDGAAETTGRKRGPYRARSGKKAARDLDVSGLEKILIAIHLGIAQLTGYQQLALADFEAAQLALASNAVLRHYNIPGLNEKTADWFNLFTALFIIYSPRMAAIRADNSEKRAAAKARPVSPSGPAGMTPRPVEIPGIGSVMPPPQDNSTVQ